MLQLKPKTNFPTLMHWQMKMVKLAMDKPEYEQHVGWLFFEEMRQQEKYEQTRN